MAMKQFTGIRRLRLRVWTMPLSSAYFFAHKLYIGDGKANGGERNQADELGPDDQQALTERQRRGPQAGVDPNHHHGRTARAQDRKQYGLDAFGI